MNGTNDENQTNQGFQDVNAPKPAAFCQHCGKPLDSSTMRVVGPAVYCEPCLAARLAGAPTSGYGSGYRAAGYTAGSYSAGSYGPVNAGGTTAGVPLAAGEPNPGLAALLGLIPGVGAMYNEQYAKGIVHLVIFAVLVSFSHVTGIFVLFVFGWMAYMSIEAHHTAQARRDGTPLPNPFGFNDIGERLGFGKAWPAGPGVAGVVRDAADAAAGFGGVGAGGVTGTPPPPNPDAVAPTGAAGWGAPPETYAATYPAANPAGTAGYQQTYPQQTYAQSYSQHYAQGPTPYAYGTQTPYGPPIPAIPPIPPMPPTLPVPNRFPAGAIWLIALGTLFLLGTTGIFHAVAGGVFIGFLLIGLGLWVFLRRMTETGMSLGDDGSPGYQFRIVRALKPSVWLVLLGVLILLDEFHVLQWRYSWPWIIIAAGVMMLVNRAMYHSASAMYPPMPTPPAPAQAPLRVDPDAAIVPAEHNPRDTNDHDELDLHQGGH